MKDNFKLDESRKIIVVDKALDEKKADEAAAAAKVVADKKVEDAKSAEQKKLDAELKVTNSYAPYHNAVDRAVREAQAANAGKPALELAAAVNVARKRANAAFKGAKPPVTKADEAKIAADKLAEEIRAEERAELARLKAL